MYKMSNMNNIRIKKCVKHQKKYEPIVNRNRQRINFNNLSRVPENSTVKLTYYNSNTNKYQYKQGIINDVFYYIPRKIKENLEFDFPHLNIYKSISNLSINNKEYFFFNNLSANKSFFEIIERNNADPITILETQYDETYEYTEIKEEEDIYCFNGLNKCLENI